MAMHFSSSSASLLLTHCRTISTTPLLTMPHTTLPPPISRKRICKATSEVNPSPAATRSLPIITKKREYSLSKGQIVRVDKEKYLNSINYLSVGHPPYFKGLDYIYEDRGEVLDIRIFETGEYALIAWAGIPTSPAWLPTSMLIKVSAKRLHSDFRVMGDLSSWM